MTMKPKIPRKKASVIFISDKMSIVDNLLPTPKNHPKNKKTTLSLLLSYNYYNLNAQLTSTINFR